MLRRLDNRFATTIFGCLLAALAIVSIAVLNGCAGLVGASGTGTDSLAISTASLASGMVGTPYSQTLQASGGTSPYSWSVTSGSLPTGLTLDASSGLLSGTPTATGTSSFTVQVADAKNGRAHRGWGIAVGNSLSITTSSLASGTVGSAYSATLQAKGGNSPYSWSLSSGSLPAGLTLNASTGVISGTPTASGTSSFTAKVTDASSNSATQSLSVAVAAATPTLSISTSSLSGGTVGTSYSATLQATGGTTPYSWSVSSGSLPAGLTLNASTGAISGTPTASGTSSFTARVTDASSNSATQSLSIAVAAATPALSISTSTLSGGTVGTAYSATLQASGGTTPYSWSVSSGSLPAGLTLNASTGAISGTPTASGTSSFTVKVTDASSNAATKSLSIAVAAATPTLAVSTSSLSGGTVGTSYSSTLQATGGTTPYSWSVSSGSLPAGLTLNGSTGVISGTPTASGTSSFTVKVTDANSNAATQSLSIAVTPALSISTSTLSGGTVGTAYSATLQASGGTAPYSWTVSSGSLPAGLTLNASTGAISGTPTASGTSSFTVKVTDASSNSATQSLTIAVAAATPTLSISTSSLSGGTVGTSYSSTLQATGGTTPYSWSVSSGSLPAGLSLNASTGAISGTPTASGTSSFTVKVTDASSNTATKSLSIAVAAATPTLSISTSSLSSGTVGTSYSATLQATGGTTPYSWSVSSGSLPAGLTLNASTGAISGTPTASGTSSFTVKVTDVSSSSATQSLSIAVAAATPALSISTSTLSGGTVGTAYSATLQASGGTTPYSWSVSTGSLPAGLTLNASTGVISGTPTASGTSSFTVKVTDASSNSATQSLSIAVAAATPTLSISTSSLSGGTVGTSYSSTLQATGGTTPYSWSVSSGSLPAGLTLNASTGVISGTPTASGTSSFAVKVTDASSNTATKLQSIVVTSALSISTSTLSGGTVGTAYSATLQASGGTTPYSWSVSSGSLPGGLALNASTGVISGTPTASGTASFTVKVTDAGSNTATQSLSIAVTPALSISTSTLSGGTVGTAYSATLQASGGTTPYSWSVSSGSLPAGLTLNASTGAISGTPTASGTSSFTVKVTDANSNAATQSLSIAVTPALSISTSTLSGGTVGTAYSATLQASGGTTPYSWSVSSGSLPAGLTLNASTGAISGTPTASGTSSFTVKVTDASSSTATKSLSIAVTSALSISTSTLSGGTVGTAYSATLQASGGATPYSWTVSSGSLPAGLTLNASTGVISGTPTASGTSSFTVKVTDASSNAATKSLSIAVTSALSISTSTLSGGTVGTAYSATLQASGGATPYSWSVSSGSLPAGLTLNASTGVISGTPTASGTSSFTVKVTDASSNTATKSLSITVAGVPLTITTTSLPGATTNTAYSAFLYAGGGTTPYTWVVSSGSLPTGLSMSSTGDITGVPTVAGAVTFSVKVTDSSSPANTATASFTVTVAQGTAYSVALAWTASPSSGVAGYNVYRSTVSGSGYVRINTTLVSPLNYTDGTVLNGTTYYYVVTAVDSSGNESGYSPQCSVAIP